MKEFLNVVLSNLLPKNINHLFLINTKANPSLGSGNIYLDLDPNFVHYLLKKLNTYISLWQYYY
jgi:hypothetical protein